MAGGSGGTRKRKPAQLLIPVATDPFMTMLSLMMRSIHVLFGLLLPFALRAQVDLQYQRPPQAMADILLAPPTPSASIDDHGTTMILSQYGTYNKVAELAQPELRIAGLRLNPNTFGPSRARYARSYSIRDLKTGKKIPVTGLPEPMQGSGPVWNPSQTKFAVSHTTDTGIDLYEVDIASGVARKVNTSPLNMVLGGFSYADDQTLTYFATLGPAGTAPARPLTPKGPVIQENSGEAAPSRTYQDLIKSPYDEDLFAFYATSQLVENKGGRETKIGPPAIHQYASISPDRQYYIIDVIRRPFSYLVPVSGFPSTISIIDRQGRTVRVLAELPSTEKSPTGFDNVQDVPRGFSWRADEPATVVWAKPLDGGLIATAVQHHDAVMQLRAPFDGAETELARTEMRYRGMTWGDERLALINEGLTGKQRVRTSTLDPRTGETTVIVDRSTNDRYNDPGSPMFRRNEFQRNVLFTVDDGRAIAMRGSGASPDGDLPFFSVFNLGTKQSEIRWRCEKGYYESVVDLLDPEKGLLITVRESPTSPANYFLRDLGAGTLTALTAFEDMQAPVRSLTKEKIRYTRRDGIELTATVYLPPGYDAARDGRLPVLMWAYPREFKKAADAAQVRGSAYTFTRVSWGSPVFYALAGYAVMDEAEFPIVGEGDRQPNDNFVEQLIWNAEAALTAAHDLGFGDTTRTAIGGHSYGAFMTANLLAHSRLFDAGIARSGAYMRTLTPFGFQNEERTYWEAPDVYHRMSPFSYADQIKDALLLIHGDADNNPGTFPLNSERLFNAVKGHGGTVRYVSLPYESHGYAGEENLLHMLWEQYTWLERHVKRTGA